MNCTFKANPGECWEGYLLDLLDKVSSFDLSDPKFKLIPPTKHYIFDWVLEGYNNLLRKKDMIGRGFEVWGVSLADLERVRN